MVRKPCSARGFCTAAPVWAIFPFDAINLGAGVTIVGAGGGGTLDGAGLYNGLFVYAGAVSIANLSIDDTVAQGGAGGSGLSGGGGGAGLGGGFTVDPTVTTNGTLTDPNIRTARKAISKSASSAPALPPPR